MTWSLWKTFCCNFLFMLSNLFWHQRTWKKRFWFTQGKKGVSACVYFSAERIKNWNLQEAVGGTVDWHGKVCDSSVQFARLGYVGVWPQIAQDTVQKGAKMKRDNDFPDSYSCTGRPHPICLTRRTCSVSPSFKLRMRSLSPRCLSLPLVRAVRFFVRKTGDEENLELLLGTKCISQIS